jgi:hypothetical protein
MDRKVNSCSKYNYVLKKLSYFHFLHSFPSAPTGAWGDGNGSPSGSVCSCPGGRVEGQSPAFQILLHCFSPCFFRSASGSFFPEVSNVELVKMAVKHAMAYLWRMRIFFSAFQIKSVALRQQNAVMSNVFEFC